MNPAPVSRVLLALAMLLSGLPAASSPSLHAADYFLTIGGGYNPSGNQASLEANVVFFQQILAEKRHPVREHEIFFADGSDAAADLQVLVKQPVKEKQPATDLLAAVHRRRDAEQVEYRNHQVPNVTGPLDPELIRASLEKFSAEVRPGDRVIVYVTAHGSEGVRGNSHNTTIDCWNEKSITARQFTGWLKKLPSDVPVIMVMAQCYCGGFGHTIFENLETSAGLSPQLRVGFFAQQHNLPAAGCRPDIDNDAEFSSYFWGAIAGRSRVGAPIRDCDLDQDGAISFAEAYAYAVAASPTIDIPMRTTDVLLRTYSRTVTDEPAADQSANSDKSDESTPGSADKKPTSADSAPKQPSPELMTVSGPLQAFAEMGRISNRRIVTQLARELGLTLQEDVGAVRAAHEQHRKRKPSNRAGSGRRTGSGRREFLAQIQEKWPELGDGRKWLESPLLRPENQQMLFEELTQLPGWKTFDQRRIQQQQSLQADEDHELRDVKFRRLISTLEIIVLEKNLPQVASPEIVKRYRQMVAVEDSSLLPAGKGAR